MNSFAFGFLFGACLSAILATVAFYFVVKFLRKEMELQRKEGLNESTQSLVANSRDVLSQTLAPLKERLSEYQKLVEQTYNSEARERFALQKEVQKLMSLNTQMEEETKNLTKALKGDVKIQGNWGEMILQRLLEGSGLQEGNEFTLQAQGMGLKGEDGNVLRPDVIINLPDNHHVIVDSKVSLKHYADYLAVDSEEGRQLLLKEMKKSLTSHIDGLASKSYQNVEGLSTPEFVFMFVPIEGAYILAIQSFPELTEYAWKKGIVITTSGTMMASLKTIASIWRVEKQSKNAEEIARKGGLIYDKIVGFCDDFDKLGEQLTRFQKVYEETAKKLYTGKGNIVGRAEELKELGARSTKSFQ